MSALTRTTEIEQERKMKTNGRISLEENMKILYSKNPHKRTRVLGIRLILFFYIGCFLQNQPENVLEVSLKFF